MKMTLVALTILLCAGFSSAQDAKPASIEQSVHDLFQLFTPEQRKQLVLPFDSPERNSEVFPPGKRPGIALKDLTEEQKKKAIALIKSFVSDHGWQKCEAISKQGTPGGLDKYFLTFFGEPGPKTNYAWRLAEHHLTIVHIEFADGKIHSVGPILLGANPPTLWTDEEDKLIALFNALAPADKEKVVKQGKADSAKPIGKAGVEIGSLSTEAREAAQAVVDQRLKFFSTDIADRIKEILKEDGGLEKQKLIYYGEATKRCADGGKWDMKLGSEKFLCDYENSRGHIHMAIKGSGD